MFIVHVYVLKIVVVLFPLRQYDVGDWLERAAHRGSFCPQIIWGVKTQNQKSSSKQHVCEGRSMFESVEEEHHINC